MTKEYKFSCGCSYPILKEIPNYDMPLLDITYENMNMDCPIPWGYYKNGLTEGVFQVDSNVGRKYSKELKPENIEHLCAQISVVRPGTLNNHDEKGKNFAQKYCDRKNGLEPTDYKYRALEPILKDTFGLIIYQEEQISIAQEIAGFTPSEADSLRRGIAKKKSDLLFSLGKQFIDGCEKVGKVNREAGTEIFDWIKSAARYSFNKCITLDTLVETTVGFKTIEELNIGELIKAPNFETEINEYVEVLDKIDTGEQDVFEITLESGKTIKCTAEHKFVCEDKIIRTLFSILEEGHKILCESE